MEQAKKTYDLEPNFMGGQIWLVAAYSANRRYDEAIALSEKALQSFPTSQPSLSFAARAYAKSGRKREAEQMIEKLREIAKTQYVGFYYVATIYAALGEKDKAFAELEKGVEQRDVWVNRLKVDPFMDPLRPDPRFKEMLKRMNLPE